MKYLFLRGSYDERTEKSIKDDDDMWQQLFVEICKDDHLCDIIFYGKDRNPISIPNSDRAIISFVDNVNKINRGGYKPDVVFSRGGFQWQVDYLKTVPNAFNIRYGAGKRYMPEPEIDYNLVLVDTEEQKADVLRDYPGCNVHLLIKPAAKHFKYMPEVEKEYDVCYIANGQQAHFKGVQWVYETAPKDLKILHLGYPSKYPVPENVTQVRVDRIDMAKWINKCKVGMVPYDSTDSCPRALVEMVACGLPVEAFNSVQFWNNRYCCMIVDKEEFWKTTKEAINISQKHIDLIVKNYTISLSIPVAAKHIRSLINV